jgi:hypothetical protein
VREHERSVGSGDRVGRGEDLADEQEIAKTARDRGRRARRQRGRRARVRAREDAAADRAADARLDVDASVRAGDDVDAEDVETAKVSLAVLTS